MSVDPPDKVTSFDRRSRAARQDRGEPDLGGGFVQRVARRGAGALRQFPGYRGYRDKEDRRDADRRVRDHLVLEYGRQLARVERVARDLADDRKVMEIGPVDDLAKAIRHLSDRINTASYGYGGLFSDRDVDEAALDQMRLFDEGLLSGVAELDGPIGELEAAHGAGGDLKAGARSGRDVVAAISTRFDGRGRVIESGAPEPRKSVRALMTLDSGTGPVAPAYWLDAGDAIEVLGQTGIVDARLDFASDAASVRLFRFGAEPEEQWLMVPARPGAPLALVSPRTAPPATMAAGSAVGIGDVTFQVASTAAGQAEVITPSAVSGYRPATGMAVASDDGTMAGLVLDWGNERQAWTGLTLGLGDLENYGPSGGRSPGQGS